MTFVWESDGADAEQGTISVTLPGGVAYHGRYFQVVETAQTDVYAPAWHGWDPYWTGWHARWYPPHYGPMNWRGFVTLYTGRVIANLESTDGKHRLRCRFQLQNPRAGLEGGGAGECQTSEGTIIEDVILAPEDQPPR